MSPRNTAVGVLVFCAGSIVVVGCGDGEQSIGATSVAATGGVKTLTGGSKGTGGSSARTGGAPSTGGSSNVAGSSNSGGTKASGGSGGIAGTSTTNVGGGTAGAAGNAGSSNAGQTSVGGTSATGGASVGTTATGGTSATSTATGGRTATGGSTVGAITTGGSPSTGGKSGTGGSSALQACTISFVVPANNATLSNSDDLDGNCQNGIQANVSVGTNAPAGATATLSMTGSSGTATQVAQTTVAGAVAQFASASLASTGTVTLTATISGTAACTASETVTFNCAGAPTCAITSPTITPAHPALNGVPVAQGGDRVSSVGSAYQAAFQIATNIQDGQPVVLTIDGSVSYQATATGGKATFGGILFASDGSHTVSATCTARSGISGSTGNLDYPVDTAAPALTPQKGTGASGATISALANGDHFVAADDADATVNGLQVKFCGTTTSADALDLPASNPNISNFCASIGGNTPVCAAATATGGNGACVNITCPGNGPFDVNLTLKDAAGNPTAVARTNLTCASTSPTVSFLDPLSDSTPFSDVTKRILATTNTGATRRDKNATTVGAQYDVITCTSAPPGSTATLSTGYVGGTLTQAATTSVVAGTATQCTGSNIAAFFNATLPESLTDSTFNLTTATELSVTVTDLNLSTGSATADVWVDSTTPNLALLSPAGFCGSYFNTSGTGSPTASVNLTFGSSIPVVVTVQGATGTNTFTGNTGTFSQVAVNGVQLEAGSDTVSAIATKPSSNFGTFGSCTVTVGDTPPPSVTWQTPLASSLLTAAGNTNAAAIIDNSANPGWQGTLTACTNIDTTANPGATVQFSATVGGVSSNIGAAVAIDATSKCATLANATVPEGAAVLLTATTSMVAGNTGVASITVPVCSTIPGAPTNITATVTDRRLTSFTPNWTAPAGSTVTGYKVRVAKTAITTQANFDAARDIPYSGSGTCPGTGCTVLVNGCYIENDYYFAVAAVDYVGNQGAFVGTTTAARASFIQTTILPVVANGRFGNVIDGTGDLNKDGYSDLIVNYSNSTEVDIFFGSAAGVPALPSVKIQGSVNQFGTAVAAIGDVINHDGYEDFAVGSPLDGNGKVYIFRGRSTAAWNAIPAHTLTASGADVTLSVDATADSKFTNSYFGSALARVGNFDNDSGGIDDFAIGAGAYNTSVGLVAIVLGNALQNLSLPATISLPSAFGTSAIRVDGDTTGGYFGDFLVGLGSFYGSNANPSLIVSAPLLGGSLGRLYSFVGTTGSVASMTAANSLNTTDGSASEYLGFGLKTLGNLGPGGQPTLGISLSYVLPTRVDLLSGPASNGPFATRTRITSTEGTTNVFGRSIVGGGISGRSTTFSFIGSTRADIAVTTRANSLPRLYIVDGDKITMPVSATIESLADVTVTLAGTFVDFSQNVTAIPDLDGDGYGDLVVAETDYGSSPVSGRVLILR